MHSFTPSRCLILLLIVTTALVSTVRAGECYTVSAEDKSKYQWSHAATLLPLENNPPNNYLYYNGTTTINPPKPKPKGIGGFFKKIFGKSANSATPTQLIHFTATVLKGKVAREYPTLLDIKSTLQDSSKYTPTQSYRVWFQRYGPTDLEYWINSADQCSSMGREAVPFTTDDIEVVYVDIKH